MRQEFEKYKQSTQTNKTILKWLSEYEKSGEIQAKYSWMARLEQWALFLDNFVSQNVALTALHFPSIPACLEGQIEAYISLMFDAPTMFYVEYPITIFFPMFHVVCFITIILRLSSKTALCCKPR